MIDLGPHGRPDRAAQRAQSSVERLHAAGAVAMRGRASIDIETIDLVKFNVVVSDVVDVRDNETVAGQAVRRLDGVSRSTLDAISTVLEAVVEVNR